VITRGHTTLPALRQALELLSPGGLLTMVLYRGHPGGNEEAGAVLEEAEQLDPKQFQIAHWRGLGQHRAPPPELLAVVRRG
jgi:hypothetical protein